MNGWAMSWGPASEVVAWTLLHFLWQGAALAAAGVIGARLLGTRSPHARYACWLTVLGLMTVAPIGGLGLRLEPTGIGVAGTA